MVAPIGNGQDQLGGTFHGLLRQSVLGNHLYEHLELFKFGNLVVGHSRFD